MGRDRSAALAAKKLETLFNDQKRWVEFIGKGNSESFYEVLKIFYEEVKQEWVDRGENAEEFETKGPKLIIVLDNASFHKQEEVIKNLAAEMPNIVLDFLPPYSPDYNLIELVWHSAKEYIANRIFKSVEQLEQLLPKLLNEGELVIRWERKIKNKGKNKGDAVNAI